MQIRIMTTDDYDKVYQLWTSTKGMGLNNLDDSREGIQRFLTRNPVSCFVAEENGIIFGAVIAGNDGRRGYIYHTAVSESRRHEGVGAALVNSAVNALKNEKINKIALVVFEKNENGNAFWEHLGFNSRDDLIYRNKSISEMERIDT